MTTYTTATIPPITLTDEQLIEETSAATQLLMSLNRLHHAIRRDVTPERMEKAEAWVDAAAERAADCVASRGRVWHWRNVALVERKPKLVARWVDEMARYHNLPIRDYTWFKD